MAFVVSLTDDRVRYRRAPFDGRQLFVPNGHNVDEEDIVDRSRADGVYQADDDLLEVKATGSKGQRSPIEPFLEVSPFDSLGSNPPSRGCNPS